MVHPSQIDPHAPLLSYFVIVLNTPQGSTSPSYADKYAIQHLGISICRKRCTKLVGCHELLDLSHEETARGCVGLLTRAGSIPVRKACYLH